MPPVRAAIFFGPIFCGCVKNLLKTLVHIMVGSNRIHLPMDLTDDHRTVTNLTYNLRNYHGKSCHFQTRDLGTKSDQFYPSKSQIRLDSCS